MNYKQPPPSIDQFESFEELWPLYSVECEFVIAVSKMNIASFVPLPGSAPPRARPRRGALRGLRDSSFPPPEPPLPLRSGGSD